MHGLIDCFKTLNFMECFSSNKLKDVNIVILAPLVKSMLLSIGDIGDLQKQTKKKRPPKVIC